MGCMLFSTDLRLSTDGLYTVGCSSNGRRASSISALPAPAAQTSAGGTACSLLPVAGCAAAQASPPHRTPIAGLTIPLLTRTCCYSPATADEPVNSRTVILPSACEGVLDEGGVRMAVLYHQTGLLYYEDTSLKTSSRVRMGLSLAWKE